MKPIDEDHLAPLYLDLKMHIDDDIEDTVFNKLVERCTEHIRFIVAKHNLQATMEDVSITRNIKVGKLIQINIIDSFLEDITSSVIEYTVLCANADLKRCVTLIETYNNCLQKLENTLHQHRT